MGLLIDPGEATMRTDGTHVDHRHTPNPGLWSALSDMVAGLQRDVFNKYRPERHYMRGPSPAWRAKHQAI
ncbi:MAG: hypothetical protein K2Y71_02545 [Xanthobacteraceae bacterium]|nr:hypothetical protein [Xanthobacteraceae bacterium]